MVLYPIRWFTLVITRVSRIRLIPKAKGRIWYQLWNTNLRQNQKKVKFPRTGLCKIPARTEHLFDKSAYLSQNLSVIPVSRYKSRLGSQPILREFLTPGSCNRCGTDNIRSAWRSCSGAVGKKSCISLVQPPSSQKKSEASTCLAFAASLIRTANRPQNDRHHNL
jgi:hypothetical protein